MQEEHAWRDLLGRIIKDPLEKQRISQELGVSGNTLTRWANGVSTPRPQNLRHLLNGLPEYRKMFLAVMPEAHAGFVADVANVDSLVPEIPSVFYATVLHTHCNLPKVLHFNMLCDVVMRQILKQLNPNQIGMRITVVRCMRPMQDGMVRTLRESVCRGTSLWENEIEKSMLFLGAESLAGYVVAAGRPFMVHNCQEGRLLFPVHWGEWEESAVACPILHANRVAGCLFIATTLPDYFLPLPLRQLVQHYAELLAIVFEDDDFIDPRFIALGKMPSHAVQQPLLASFRRRIAEVMLQRSVSVMDAERIVWQRVEEELLGLSYVLAE